MRTTTTSTGLQTTVNVIGRIYATGKTATNALKDHIRTTTTRLADFLPKWNVVAKILRVWARAQVDA